ncbi:DUF4172 domain-containing protein [Sphingomonas sp. MS122]|uniref:DUF4172 domain-containing protein n=1 Tax=Sphingomonas sp. MS122 TaxID=3412683 RepID=UPI003C2C6B5E
MSHEAIDTLAIEGETLDRDSVQSPIRQHLRPRGIINPGSPSCARMTDRSGITGPPAARRHSEEAPAEADA